MDYYTKLLVITQGAQHPFNCIKNIKPNKMKSSNTRQYDLTLEFAGHGHYKLITTRYGKKVSMITNDMQLIDRIQDGSNAARNEAIRQVRLHNFLFKN